MATTLQDDSQAKAEVAAMQGDLFGPCHLEHGSGNGLDVVTVAGEGPYEVFRTTRLGTEVVFKRLRGDGIRGVAAIHRRTALQHWASRAIGWFTGWKLDLFHDASLGLGSCHRQRRNPAVTEQGAE